MGPTTMCRSVQRKPTPSATSSCGATAAATDATDRYKGFERASTFADPATRWPDFDPNIPPRPSLLAITKLGGGKIG